MSSVIYYSCVCRENPSDSWYIPWYTTRKRCITSIYSQLNKMIWRFIHRTDYIIASHDLDIMILNCNTNSHLYHAIENTANQNTGKLLYTGRYHSQPSHRPLHWLCWPLYFLWHGIQKSCNTFSWYTTKECYIASLYSQLNKMISHFVLQLEHRFNLNVSRTRMKQQYINYCHERSQRKKLS